MMRKTALVMAVGALAVGPWLGGSSSSGSILPVSSYAASALGVPAHAAVDGPAEDPPVPIVRQRRGCTCREVVVNAENVVRNAEVRSGDSKIVNRSLTYIAPSFSDNEVEVDQDAEARSGDAVAGQIVEVDAGEGCSRVHVRARNLVEEAEVRSGDATAENHSVVLVDPRLKRGDLEIEVDQEAEAISGRVIGGQIIKVRGGGGPCGGVIVEAINRLREVELRSGEADTFNASDILTCESEGCIDDIREALRGVDSVQVCAEDDCEDVSVADFVKALEERAEADEDDDDQGADDDDDEEEEDDEDAEEESATLEEPATADTKKRGRRRHRPQPTTTEPATDTAVESPPEPSTEPPPPPENAT